LAAYPYSDQITARLAQQYAMDGQPAKARSQIDHYRKVFPEDSVVRELEQHLDEPAAAPH